jgi:hypothetical protein
MAAKYTKWPEHTPNSNGIHITQLLCSKSDLVVYIRAEKTEILLF